MIYDCIIIGAGASGLFCSSTFAKPVKGLVLEKSKSPGTKLLMSGNGQCNITHSGSIKDFVSCYGKNGGKIRSCLYRYNNNSLISFLNENGLNTTVRNDGKVFPASMNAKDVLNLLLKKSIQNGFKINTNENIQHISKAPLGWEIISNKNSYISKSVVIAAGGCSYPATGSDGSIFPVLKKALKLSSTPLVPALSSIQVIDYPYCELSGISFENAKISIFQNQKKTAENVGALLFTHTDFSGPGILNISKYAAPENIIEINYLYPLNYETAFERLKKALHGNKSQTSTIVASEFSLSKRFVQNLVKRAGNSAKAISLTLTGEKFTVHSTSGFSKAMVTSGGIELSQINMKTMEAKKLPGIFIIGEVLDIDGITGGYNLQFAYSSAKTASDSILLRSRM